MGSEGDGIQFTLFPCFYLKPKGGVNSVQQQTSVSIPLISIRLGGCVC